MKARTIFFIVVILCLNLVLTGAAAAGTAGPPNPAERFTDLGAPRSTTGRPAPTAGPASPDAPTVAMGQPGTAFRYVRTFGVTEKPIRPMCSTSTTLPVCSSIVTMTYLLLRKMAVECSSIALHQMELTC